MKRRDFIEKTGYGIAGAFTSYHGFKRKKNAILLEDNNRIHPNFTIDFDELRNDFPPLRKSLVYLDTAFVGLLPEQVKAAHETFLNERLAFGPFPADQSILGYWMDRIFLDQQEWKWILHCCLNSSAVN